MTYDFLEGSKIGEYLLEQSSEGYVKNLNVSYKVSYAGKLAVPDISACSKMTITYPLIRKKRIYIQPVAMLLREFKLSELILKKKFQRHYLSYTQ